MIKGAVGKALGLGRTTALPVVLAVMLMVVFGTTPASAHGGYKGLLHLGHSKAVAKVTTLVGKVATGSALVVKNPSDGSALGLEVNAGKAPLTVNADAGKATNLDADKLDGKEASDFYAAGSKVDDSDKLDGIDSTAFAAAAHDHDSRYYTETESDGRYLGKTQKAADSDKLDGLDSTQFVQGKGRAMQGAKAISPGQSDTPLVHGPQTPYVSVSYDCPSDLTNLGTLKIKNLGSETINVFVDNLGQSNPAYFQLAKDQAVLSSSAPSGEHITAQLQGSGIGTIEVFSVHRSSDCHVQTQGLFTSP